MFNILHTLIDRKKKVRYINVGEVNNNAYLGWKLLRSKKQYVTINPTTGNIDWYYTFSNGSWHKFDKEGTEYPMVATYFKVTMEFDANKGNVSATIKAPNTYVDSWETTVTSEGVIKKGTFEVTKVTYDDAEIIFTATPEDDYEFTKYTIGTTDETDNPLTIEVNSDTECTATFTATSE